MMLQRKGSLAVTVNVGGRLADKAPPYNPLGVVIQSKETPAG